VLAPPAALIGRCALRQFESGTFVGVILSTRFTQAHGQLWLVRYADGDREELSREELQRALQPVEARELREFAGAGADGDAAPAATQHAALPTNGAAAADSQLPASERHYKGVCSKLSRTYPFKRRYYAEMHSGGRHLGLGSFCTAVEAACAYDDAARARGRLAVNFPHAGGDEVQAIPGRSRHMYSSGRFNAGVATPVQRFKGVSTGRSAGRWRVEIQASGKKSYVGVFADPVAAAHAYDAAARAHGIRVVNFPNPGTAELQAVAGAHLGRVPAPPPSSSRARASRPAATASKFSVALRKKDKRRCKPGTAGAGGAPRSRGHARAPRRRPPGMVAQPASAEATLSTAHRGAGSQPSGAAPALRTAAPAALESSWQSGTFVVILEHIVELGCAGGGLDAVKLLCASAAVCKAWKEALPRKVIRKTWRDICRFPLPARCFSDSRVQLLCASGAWLLVDELRWLDCSALTSKAIASIVTRTVIIEDEKTSVSPAPVLKLEWAGCAEAADVKEVRALLATWPGALLELRLPRAGAGTRTHATLVELLADVRTHGGALRALSLTHCPGLSAQLITEHLTSAHALEELDVSGSGANVKGAAKLPHIAWGNAWPRLRALRMDNFPAAGCLSIDVVGHHAGVFAALDTFSAAAPRPQHFSAAAVPTLQLDDARLRALLSGCASLTHLDLSGHSALSSRVLETALHKDVKLRTLRVDRTAAGDDRCVRKITATLLPRCTQALRLTRARVCVCVRVRAFRARSPPRSAGRTR
jgi:hypothetical protein